ncbi:DUF692 domain-containing protein [Alteromonas lipolytica]|uniref:DUF692 domain-containing protein n=1 Tax=Alteromonas lipolytica TaxID=1856405 RepID=A0A1E8F8D8_9ALTE|nr:DUF692 domain-containing protein [Alteromonas lipolytica]OFI32181.1 hypothetical protein BFC17_08120 [Alteromonas lipolytica]GGF83235.1 UPF0276 protein [Alteromonas lipolytica]
MAVLKPGGQALTSSAPVGVGLRHEHYSAALMQPSSSIDFVEIHAENFFADGGAICRLSDQIRDSYPVSIHGTAMGLGSAQGINPDYLKAFANLVKRIDPVLISDHACFTWGKLGNSPVHAGDLLPLKFDRATLDVLCDNIDRVQQLLGRQLLIENIVTYIPVAQSQFTETEFLSRVVEQTQCGLLVDLNNILVNYHNFSRENPLVQARQWLSELPAQAVKELHLAGSSPAAPGKLVVDDHGQPVSDDCWALFHNAHERFPEAATLIEWDNNLPQWPQLLAEAEQARRHMDMMVLEIAK